jgi:hypothetical protein
MKTLLPLTLTLLVSCASQKQAIQAPPTPLVEVIDYGPPETGQDYRPKGPVHVDWANKKVVFDGCSLPMENRWIRITRTEGELIIAGFID